MLQHLPRTILENVNTDFTAVNFSDVITVIQLDGVERYKNILPPWKLQCESDNNTHEL